MGDGGTRGLTRKATGVEAGRAARDVYSFGHFPIIAGIIGFAVAIEECVAHPLEPLTTPAVIALIVGVGLFVGGVAWPCCSLGALYRGGD